MTVVLRTVNQIGIYERRCKSVLRLLLLRLLRSQLSGSIIVNPSRKSDISFVNEPNRVSLLQNPLIDICTTIFELNINSVLDEKVLSQKEHLDDPAHEVKRKAHYHVQKDEYLDSSFALVDIEFVVADQVSIIVEPMGREFDFHKLNNTVCKE